MLRNPTDSEFLDAASSNDLDTIRAYLTNNPQPAAINATDQYGRTALTRAAVNGRTDVVKLLLARPDIDINAKNQGRQTALMVAAFFNQTAVAKLLLARPDIDIYALDILNENAFQYATRGGSTEIFELLLARPDAKKPDGQSALDFALSVGSEKIVKLLLEKPDIYINAGVDHLIKSVSQGYTDIVKLLLARPNIDINAKDNDHENALMHAAKNGHTEIVKLLLARVNIDINAKNHKDCNSLMHAAKNGHTEIVKLLLARPNIDINAKNHKGYNSFMLAAKNGHTEIVKLLLEAGTAKNQEGQTAEMLTRTDEVRVLIQKTLESRLKVLETRRALLTRALRTYAQCSERMAVAKSPSSSAPTTDEISTQATSNDPYQAIQKIADITQQSFLNDLNFLMEQRDQLNDFSLLPEMVMRFSEFIMTVTDEDKKLTDYARQLRKVAASMGQKVALHIEERYSNDKAPLSEKGRDLSPARGAPAALGLFTNPHTEQDRQDRRANRPK